MHIAVHPEAARRADELATRALDGLVDGRLTGSTHTIGYSPPLPTAGVFDDTNIKGPILGSTVDRFGRDIERSYLDANRAFVLRGAAFGDYEKAVLTLHGQRHVKEVASEKTLRTLAFEWIYGTHLHGPAQAFCEYVLQKLGALVQEVEIVLPIVGLHIHAPTKIGRVVIGDILPSELSDWRERSRRGAEKLATMVDVAHDKLDRTLQGRAAARFKVTAEPEHAADLAVEQAELSLAVLRLASDGAFFPERPSSFALAGSDAPPHGSHVVLGPGDSVLPKQYLLHPEAYEAWVLDEPYLRGTVLPMIGHWSDLLAKDSRTKLEENALSSVLLYSRATRSRNTVRS